MNLELESCSATGKMKMGLAKDGERNVNSLMLDTVSYVKIDFTYGNIFLHRTSDSTLSSYSLYSHLNYGKNDLFSTFNIVFTKPEMKSL